ncbi:MAG: hypothetical protein H0V79_06455 [Actinobacteria bacterium]|nr:hypothetical protein [Actinomycetota bacterium]
MAGKKILVVTTVKADESEVRNQLADAEEIRIVAPAAKISWLGWLTNDEGDARGEAQQAAERVAQAVGNDARVQVDETSQNTDAAQDVADALRSFPADEIVVLTRSGEDSSWLEDDAVRASFEAHGVPVRHLEL